MTSETNTDHQKIEELEITIGIRDAQISLLNKKIDEMNKKITVFESEKLEYQRRRDSLDRDIMNFRKRVKSADYYDGLVELLEKTPSLQGDWVKFVSLIKLVCDPDDLKKIT